MAGIFNRRSATPSNPAGDAAACAPYLSPYRCVVNKIGAKFEALLWNSEETQRLRFEAITSTINLERQVVLDAGCGRADLAVWMRDQGIHWHRYIGVDAIPEMLDHARSLSLPHADFFLADFVTDDRAFLCAGEAPDVVVFSGSLNTIPRQLAVRALQRAWRDCRRALVFNFLSAGDGPPPGEAPPGAAQKLSPPAVLKWALAHTPDVTLKHDYLEGRDATVFMIKSGATMRK